MSGNWDKCGNCDCSDQSQCVKNGNTAEIIETEEISYTETVVTDAPAAAEQHNPFCKCKCGGCCTCLHCKCGH